MNQSTIHTRDEIIRIVADIFDVPVSSVTDETSQETIETWDSVQHLNLVLAVEAQMGVRFEPEEIEQMQSVGAILATVARKVG